MKTYEIGNYGQLIQFARRHVRRMSPFLTPPKTLNALRALSAMLAGRSVLASRPFVIRADVSAVCNLRCPPCKTWRRQKDFPPEKRLMKIETFRRIVEAVKPHCLRLSLYDTGEPLMNPEFYRMVEMASAAGIGTCVSTNFTLFEPEDLDRLFESGLKHLEVCLDGFSQKAYERYRVGGDVEKLKRNLALVCRAKRERKSRYPEIDIQVVKFSHLRDEIPAIVDFGRRIGADSVTLREENLDFEPRAAAGKPSAARQRRFWKLRRCYWLWLGMLVKADGSVSPCCGPRPVFGDINRQTLDEIWNNPRFVESRQAVVDPSYRPHLPTPCSPGMISTLIGKCVYRNERP